MKTEIREIQRHCLQLLDIADGICRKHGINYSLCGGSVVGAYLYKGCLPWDDDVDLMMTRENYNLFIEIARKELPDGYVLMTISQDSSYNQTISKIVNERTTLVQANGEVFGVFLDITCYDRVPMNKLYRKIDMFLLGLIFTIRRGKISGWSIKNKIRSLLLDTLFSKRQKCLLLIQHLVERIGMLSTRYEYMEIFGAWAQYIPYRSSVFENYTTIEFEGKKYMIVRDYIEYLQTRYSRTDFREPKEKQVAPHYEYVDFNLPYKDYLKRKNENTSSNSK